MNNFNILYNYQRFIVYIVSINNNNLKMFSLLFDKYIVNFNYILKNIKLNIIINFIKFNYKELIIVFNKIIFLFIINNYIKNINNLNFNNI